MSVISFRSTRQTLRTDPSPCAASQPETFEHRLVPAPLRRRLHLQLEVDGMPEELLDRGPRRAADLAHHRTALADQDLLLALGLGVEADVEVAILELDDLGRERVRHLLLREP